METILLAAGLMAVINTVDYVRFATLGLKYSYVSRETYFLYVFGVIVTLLAFHVELGKFLQPNAGSEFVFIAIAFIASLLASFGLRKSHVRVCLTILRTGKCFEPAYILVKSKEILFHQLLFIVLAVSVSREITDNFSAVMLFLTIVLIMQIPRMLQVERFWKLLFLIGFGAMSVIFYYTYTKIGLLWPALHVHALFYAFIWIVLSDPTEEAGLITKNRG